MLLQLYDFQYLLILFYWLFNLFVENENVEVQLPNKIQQFWLNKDLQQKDFRY